ncbi:hypothetical protein ACFWPK_23185 [Nocardia sp. NPDC058519]|uniref:DUF7373 family lipoprotein n=1 Tax=Nocardia sp. NPDC058519 TaxID=3346535 RepID=UPI003657CC1C
MIALRATKVVCVLATALLTTVVTACGGPDEITVTDAPVDLATLDVGNYPTQPRQIGTVANLDQGRFIEAERLGDFVPTPADIDPRFVHTNPSIASVFLDAEAALGKIMAVDRFAEVAPDFIGGFVSSAETEPNNMGLDMVNAVMIFPDAQKATTAAAELEKLDFGYAPNNQRIEIPGYPAAIAHWQPDQQSIGSWFATGHLVIYTWFYDYLKIWLEKVDKQALLDLTRKSLDTIVPSVAKFTPTTGDLMTLQRDRDGMLGRTAPRPREDSWINPPGVYAGRTARHFLSDPVSAAKMIDDYGIDLYANDGAEVYRARDIAGAQGVRDELGGVTRKFTASASPKNLPSAQCKEYIGRKQRIAIRFYCAVSYDRYAAYVWSNQLLDAQQRISAQYALLVNAK